MKRIVMTLALLTLISCSDPIRGGNITGKYTKIQQGGIFEEDTVKYYLQLQKNGENGRVLVTREAWEQAKSGMMWPFEVK